MSSQSDDMIEAKNDKVLADILGITVSELLELEWIIHENSSDDGFVYGHSIQFSDNSPKRILRKIKGIDSNNTIDIGTDLFL